MLSYVHKGFWLHSKNIISHYYHANEYYAETNINFVWQLAG